MTRSWGAALTNTLLIWKNSRLGTSETRHNVADLDDLRELLATELGDRILYLVARSEDDETLDQRLRSSISDLTDEDFHWLTAPVAHEVRGVTARQ